MLGTGYSISGLIELLNQIGPNHFYLPLDSYRIAVYSFNNELLGHIDCLTARYRKVA
jgi:hypothetical protein